MGVDWQMGLGQTLTKKETKFFLCTGQKFGNGRETRLFPRRADSPTARKKLAPDVFYRGLGFLPQIIFLSCTQLNFSKKLGFFPLLHVECKADLHAFLPDAIFSPCPCPIPEEAGFVCLAS